MAAERDTVMLRAGDGKPVTMGLDEFGERSRDLQDRLAALKADVLRPKIVRKDVKGPNGIVVGSIMTLAFAVEVEIGGLLDGLSWAQVREWLEGLSCRVSVPAVAQGELGLERGDAAAEE